MSQVRRAIIIAAGRGRRLGPHTEEIPKCMVQVGARSILEWQWRALQEAGITELIMIRGYRADVLTSFAHKLVPSASFFDNPQWQSNNVLLSLACARAALDQPALVLYSDIVFTPAVACAAAACQDEIGLVIDRSFRDIYHGRTEHPLDEAEVARTGRDGKVAQVGKRALPADEAEGEFIGLVKLGAQGVTTVAHALDELAERYRGREHEPFARAQTFRNAYLTDLLQELIDGGVGQRQDRGSAPGAAAASLHASSPHAAHAAHAAGHVEQVSPEPAAQRPL
ncbi:MAG TPA: phosphocholine cytidylyltransferase family protein, partial [Kofleriaceae bacterium]|nr:phosphocholine cytidylyltransferase family protein [Kofleriaceae bacterium]